MAGNNIQYCPECGAQVRHESGCSTCPICGWSACNIQEVVRIDVFRDKEKLEKAYLEAGGIRNLAKSLRVSVNTVRRYLREYKITDGDGNYIGDKPKPPTEISGEQMLKHLKTPMSVIDLANKFDCAPRSLQPTYEEWKQNRSTTFQSQPASLQPTYEEWKQNPGA